MTTKQKQFIEQGKRLKSIRVNSLKLSTEEFAKPLGISTKYVNMMERGDRSASPSLLAKMAKVYNIPADTLISGREYQGQAKVKHSDPIALEVEVTHLRARVDQLERLFAHYITSNKSKDP